MEDGTRSAVSTVHGRQHRERIVPKKKLLSGPSSETNPMWRSLLFRRNPASFDIDSATDRAVRLLGSGATEEYVFERLRKDGLEDDEIYLAVKAAEMRLGWE